MKGREVYTRGTTLIASILDANLDHFNGVKPKSLTIHFSDSTQE